MNPKQRRFAEEYVVDHNGTQAAIRAGYSADSAKSRASKLLANSEVSQLVAKLDSEKAEALGISAEDVIAEILGKLEVAGTVQPKLWKGQPVMWTDPETDKTRIAVEFVSAALTGRLLELLFKKSGFDLSRSEVEEKGEFVIRLVTPRDLNSEE